MILFRITLTEEKKMSNYDSFDDNAEQTMFPNVDANYDDANDF